MEEKVRISEIIVVEGLHDKQAVERAVEAEVWYVGGDRVAYGTVEALQRAAEHRGVIVFTDPDGPGERIRSRLSAAIPTAKHAFLERRDAMASARVSLGVEHAQVTAIVQALAAARPTHLAKQSCGEPIFTMADLHAAGLVDTQQAVARRKAVGRELRIGYGNAKAFLRKLNTLGVTRAEWQTALARLPDSSESLSERNPDP